MAFTERDFEGAYMLDKEYFFKHYKVRDYFENSGLQWEVLQEIYDNYQHRHDDFVNCASEIKKYILEGMENDKNLNIHSISSRVKDSEHLIEKIIRKRGMEQNQKYERIDATNYREVVRDLVGVRILVLAKEQWETVFDWLLMKFPGGSKDEYGMVEDPIAYIRYGDRDIFQERIRREHTNKGYRSQHYIVRFKDHYCEIQVRTLAEEVYGEFDHKVKYPYRDENKFLKRYTSMVSQFLSSVDEMISTCFQLGEKGWEGCDLLCKEDAYIDWKNIAQFPQASLLSEKALEKTKSSEAVDIAAYANNILFRKG